MRRRGSRLINFGLFPGAHGLIVLQKTEDQHDMTRKAFIPTSIGVIWLLTPAILSVVVIRNADNNVYGTSDAVLIPIMEAVFFCVIALPYLMFFAWSGMKRCSVTLKPWAFKTTIRQWILLLLFLFGAFILLAQVLYWSDLSHFPIAICYFVVLAWLVWIRPYASQTKTAEQVGTGQPATRPVLESEGSDKPQPVAEGRSR